MKLTYDVIYLVYFYLDDYTTICNMFLLDKTFINHYLKYNKVFKHKFKILFYNLFNFLSLIPHSTLKTTDLDFLTCPYQDVIETAFVYPKIQKDVMKNDIYFIYKLYKNLVYNEMVRCFGIRYVTDLSPRLTSIILVQGPFYLDRCIKIYFNKNKIKLFLDPKSRILSYNSAANFRFLMDQLDLFENYFN